MIRAAFIHIPKTGGTSVRAMFDGLLFNVLHAPLSSYREALQTSPHIDWERLFKFSFVRNPWGRWLSCFFHNSRPRTLQEPGEYHDALAKFLGKSHLCPWGTTTPANLIGDGVDSLDFIGRFENINSDTLTVADKLGVDTMTVPHRGESTVGTVDDWQPYYTNETREMVAELGAWEIERFGYGFDDCAVCL
jgi:hypothetical protein